MIIELEDEHRRPYSIDADVCTREELVETCVMLHRWWRHVCTVLDDQNELATTCGLSIGGADIEIVDGAKADAWFEDARAECSDPRKSSNDNDDGLSF
jgi:hypothetical protein